MCKTEIRVFSKKPSFKDLCVLFVSEGRATNHMITINHGSGLPLQLWAFHCHDSIDARTHHKLALHHLHTLLVRPHLGW